MKKHDDNYKDSDDLELYMTLIENSTMTFSPRRTLEFRIIKPVDFTENEIKYSKGILLFENIVFSNLALQNETTEYPEFYRSAVLTNSDLLDETKNNLQRMRKTISEDLKHYYLYIDQGNFESEVHIICEKHKLILEGEQKSLSMFEGFDE